MHALGRVSAPLHASQTCTAAEMVSAPGDLRPPRLMPKKCNAADASEAEKYHEHILCSFRDSLCHCSTIYCTGEHCLSVLVCYTQLKIGCRG